MFINEQDGCIKIIPHLLKEFHCGRLINASLHDKGMLDVEWTKKTIRRMRFLSKEDGEIAFHFKGVSSYRLKYHGNEERFSNGKALSFQKNIDYHFDNFL
jgi:hypothetical protein